MAMSSGPAPAGRLKSWLLSGHPRVRAGIGARPHRDDTHPWWKVMCLTGVDYFSTLGYQPGIAALAAGVLAPVATLILVIVTLFGALPMYKRVASRSPHGDGSVSMLERLLPWWQGKLFVLCLIGFIATGFVITITLSSADATAHVVENPMTAFLHGHEILVTVVLIGMLGAVFLKGFSEAIGIAVVLVVVYLLLNVVVVAAGFIHLSNHPELVANWTNALSSDYASPAAALGSAVYVFPALALGLSGFETGVLVMPQVRGSAGDAPAFPAGRIRSTHRLLTVAALIMSVMLLASSVVTVLLIPEEAFAEGGAANGRALSYIAHGHLGEGFGTVYDISTISILWFAGASAMAGLLNIVPRYLPRYGMAPDWTRANRPLVLLFTIVCLVVTIGFRADVDAQAGAYATGVLAVITSATIAVTLSVRAQGDRRATILFGAVAAVFVYTTVVTILEDPQGLRIALVFIGAIIVTSLVSRVWRSTELRIESVVFDSEATRFVRQSSASGPVRVIANHPDERTPREYLLKERQEREASHIPYGTKPLFLEVTVTDASEFAPAVRVHGEQVGPYRALKVFSPSVPNAIAAVLIDIRDQTGERPHVYFGWAEGNPLRYLARFVLFGEGDIAPVTHEILRKAEPDPARRPAVHVG
jgi:hypothetical protein